MTSKRERERQKRKVEGWLIKRARALCVTRDRLIAEICAFDFGLSRARLLALASKEGVYKLYDVKRAAELLQTVKGGA